MKKALLVILFASVFVLISSCTPRAQEQEPKDAKYCQTSLDCVAATCCHPDDVINKKYAPDCSATLCTAACLGPLDCGAGKIECIENKCVLVKIN